jgi:uncharacterized protein YjiS (DUF1127 family)
MALLTDGLRTEFQGHSAIVSFIRSVWLAIGAASGRIVMTLSVWHERALQRRQLLALNERALKDFGCTLTDAATEGHRPFWRA